MSSYETSSPESDMTCNSLDSCGAPPPHKKAKKHHSIDKTKRLKASARERKRRHVLNDALELLRGKVSWMHETPQKLSTTDVLRLASDYIGMMTCQLSAPGMQQENGMDFLPQQLPPQLRQRFQHHFQQQQHQQKHDQHYQHQYHQHYQQPVFMPQYQQPVFIPQYQQPAFMPQYLQPVFIPQYQQPVFMPQQVIHPFAAPLQTQVSRFSLYWS